MGGWLECLSVGWRLNQRASSTDPLLDRQPSPLCQSHICWPITDSSPRNQQFKVLLCCQKTTYHLTHRPTPQARRGTVSGQWGCGFMDEFAKGMIAQSCGDCLRCVEGLLCMRVECFFCWKRLWLVNQDEGKNTIHMVSHIVA